LNEPLFNRLTLDPFLTSIKSGPLPGYKDSVPWPKRRIDKRTVSDGVIAPLSRTLTRNLGPYTDALDVARALTSVTCERERKRGLLLRSFLALSKPWISHEIKESWGLDVTVSIHLKNLNNKFRDINQNPIYCDTTKIICAIGTKKYKYFFFYSQNKNKLQNIKYIKSYSMDFMYKVLYENRNVTSIYNIHLQHVSKQDIDFNHVKVAFDTFYISKWYRHPINLLSILCKICSITQVRISILTLNNLHKCF